MKNIRSGWYTHWGPGLRGPGCLLGVWFCPAFLGCHPVAAVCNMIKFGFKKDDFSRSVGNVQEEVKPGVCTVKSGDSYGCTDRKRRASAISSGCQNGK